MPSYYDQEETEMDERVVARPGLQGTRTFLALTAIYCYYLFSCGLEGFFQSMTCRNTIIDTKHFFCVFSMYFFCTV